MVVEDKTIIIRRARGYAPLSIKLPFELKENILAFGANQKSTIAIGFKNEAIISPYIGDLNSLESILHYNKILNRLKDIYNFKPDVVVCDKHPLYESTKIAKDFANRNNTKIKPIQHHYAHITAVMAEHSIKTEVFGIAFDGTGYGDDKNLWGGEFLVCDYSSYKRVCSFSYFKLLGGEKAIKEPRRVALSMLFEIYGDGVFELKNYTTKSFSKAELKSLYIAWEKSLNSPISSSVGRLFDAIYSLTGIAQTISYEGESGMVLEEYFDENIKGYYPFVIKESKVDFFPMIKEILKESDKTVAISKFFNTLVEIINEIYKPYSNLPLVISGGVFQNRVLLKLLINRFKNLIIPQQIPPNDSSISLGQIASELNPNYAIEIHRKALII